MTTFDTKLPNRADRTKPDFGQLAAAFTINVDMLGWALDKCIGAVGSDPKRPALDGLHIAHDTLGSHKGIRVVATDGVRLRRCNLPEAVNADKPPLEGFGAIITTKGAGALIDAILETDPSEDITVRQYVRAVTFETKGWTLHTKPIASDYVDTLRVMPQAKDIKHAALVDAARAIKTVQLAATVATLKATTRITLGADNLSLYVKGTRGHREEAVAAKVKGGPFAVNIQAQRIFDALKALERVEEDGTTVVPGFAEIGFQTEPSKPLMIRDPKEPDFIQVVMPDLQAPPQALAASQEKAPRKANEQGLGKAIPGTPGPRKAPQVAPRHKPLSPGKPHPKPGKSKAPTIQAQKPARGAEPKATPETAHAAA